MPGNYVALNVSGSGQPGFAPFTVTQSPSPAALPPAAATQTAIEFAFRGTVVHDGTTVRAQNNGWLVHMIDLTRVPHAAIGAQVMALLQAGKDNQAFKLLRQPGVRHPARPGLAGSDAAAGPARSARLLRRGLLHGQPGRSRAPQFGMLRLVRIV